jgi:predicted Holliday junction resolvase-like endonuclease
MIIVILSLFIIVLVVKLIHSERDYFGETNSLKREIKIKEKEISLLTGEINYLKSKLGY